MPIDITAVGWDRVIGKKGRKCELKCVPYSQPSQSSWASLWHKSGRQVWMGSVSDEVWSRCSDRHRSNQSVGLDSERIRPPESNRFRFGRNAAFTSPWSNDLLGEGCRGASKLAFVCVALQIPCLVACSTVSDTHLVCLRSL